MADKSSLSRTWGTSSNERRLGFPCDRFIEHFDDSYYRGITIWASPEIIYRWLCQMRVAPYSYDWIDNFGRLSPRNLIPGIGRLAIGQEVMTIFELVAFKPNHHLTIRLKRNKLALKIFGDAAASYMIVPENGGICRLLVKLVVKYPPGFIGRLIRLLLPWGDLVMMRRQLLNFKELAEWKNLQYS
jgi:hypothetical protein